MKLRHYVIRRILLLFPVLLGVITITFFLIYLVPSNPARLIAGPRATGDQLKQINLELGLDKPIYVRYFMYLKKLIKGDLGRSILTRRPVLDDLMTFFPATLELTLASMLIMVPMGILLGVISAIKRNSSLDHIIRIFALSGVSMPVYWLGLILLLVFYFKLGILPGPGRLDPHIVPPPMITGLYILDSLLTGRWDAFTSSIKHIILPAMTLAYATTGMTARVMRSSMLDVISAEYIRTARAKGLGFWQIVFRHALRNALIAPLTFIGYQFGYLLAGAVLTESIFGWPGLGRYAVEAMTNVDFPAVLGVVILTTIIYVIVNLVVDIAYVVIDPRIRLGGKE
ncbi:MAG: ABC transporter permease [Synergistetes bacterium]|nr:ABC transporter permease [Synergistota bacterium]MCX8128309.1 ABC transporter permease [Synergistota bacterium]MDW8192628.1 ABC transporter permease [Synergistota bacterium]